MKAVKNFFGGLLVISVMVITMIGCGLILNNLGIAL